MGTLYDNGRAYQNSWIVYINGLQVPVAAVQTSHGVWQIPEAAIQMVPEPVLQRLGAEDRVQVQVFYCDQWFRSPPEFCLLFDGEIVAWSYVSTAGSRAISFSCVDYTQILTQLFFFFMSSFDDIAVGVSGAAIGVQGSTVQLAGFGALYPYSLFTQGLADTTTDPDNPNVEVIKRPIDFAYNIVRALIKLDHPNRTVPGANFFAPWTKRTNYHKRWVALPYVDADPGGNPGLGVFPILRAKQAEEALAAVARKASNVGSQGSMWDMLREVLMTMMMEVAMVPTPAAVRSDFRTLLPKGPVDGNAGPTFLTNYFVKPQFLFGLPPAFNVFFPPQISDYAYNENYITQPTRMYFNEETLLSYLNRNATASAGVVGMMQDALCTAYPEEVDNAARSAQSAQAQNGKNLLVYPEEFFKGPVIDRRTMPSWFVFLQQAIAGSGTGEVDEDVSDAPDGDGNNIADPGAAGTRTAENDEDLSGASEAVFQPRNTEEAIRTFGELLRTLPSRGAYASPDLRTRMRSNRFHGTPSRAVPPDRFPIKNKALVTGFSDTFYSSRRDGEKLRIHAGHDFPVSSYEATVVSVTPGKIVRFRTYDHPTNRQQWQGNAVHIEDEHGAIHRYMHLDTINPEILSKEHNPNTQFLTTPFQIPSGYVLGTAGNSGRGRNRGGANGKHLHYDVTTANGYRLNYSDRFRRLRDNRGVAASPTTSRSADAPPSARDTRTSDISSGDTEQNIFQLYAAYEYYKERYARRQGAVSMPFNPYPVAGFPCATFDRRSSSVDTVGYVMSVRHTLTTQSWSTDVAFSHGRTLQEMFSLMQRHVAYENARLGLRQQDISRAVESRQITQPNEAEDQTADEALSGIALPSGPIATAPAEPIPEIRSLIQDFSRADEFYKAMFYHGAAPGADVLSAEQAQRTSLSGPTQPTNYLTEDDVATMVSAGVDPTTLVARSHTIVAENSTRPTAPVTAAPRPTGGGVFRYPDIIDLVTPEGNRVGIEIFGYDAVTRDRMLGLIAQIRTGNVPDEEDLALFEQAFETTIALPNPGEPISEDLHRFLNAKEYELRATGASVNVRGDVTIVPKDSAEGLFSDFSAAMAYNGRPVCTLEEYIEFLGPDGLREGRVDPGVTAASRGEQLHPAHFYTRIRRFRAGPPLSRPRTNLTNTPTVTDAPAGPIAVPVEARTAPEEPTLLGQLAAIGQAVRGLFNTAVDIEITQPLERLRADIARLRSAATGVAVTGLNVGLETINGGLETIRRELTNAARTGQIPQETYQRIDEVLRAAETITEPNTEVPRPAYDVEGIPADFPDTRADWDAVLEQYRHNVLNKLAPNS